MIGVYDSGVGGLSVWGEIVRCLPDVPLLYVGDQAHVPYGARSPEEVRALAEQNARWLLARGCDMIVVACNTASAVALQHLRQAFPHTPFVGMEPALKPAARQTQTGVIGILATPVTFRGPLYASLMARYSAGVTVLEQPCRDWVDAVEHLEISDWASALEQQDRPDVAALREMVAKAVEPLLEQQADTLVLGCTHFPFLLPLIQQVIEQWRARHPDSRPVGVIDPAPAVARQTAHVWHSLVRQIESNDVPSRTFWTTGDPAQFVHIASLLLGEPVMCAQAVWDC